jgi:hypothetical protein
MAEIAPAPKFKRLAAQMIRAAFLAPAGEPPPPAIEAADWPLVAAAAKREGIAPLLHAALKALGRGAEPPLAARDALRYAYVLADGANWMAFRELAQILDLFAAEGVPVVLLKGCALAATLYAEPAHRPMGDLDLLLPREAVARAGGLLESRGFREKPEMTDGFSLDYLQEKIFVRLRPAPAQVDLHWHLTSMPHYQRRVPMEWFWERAVERPVAGRLARVFTPTAQVLHLSLHFALHHRAERLIWSHDLALLLSRQGGDLDGAELVGAARSFGLARAVQTTLAVVRDWWGVAAPDEAQARLAALRPPAAERLFLAVMSARRHEARILSDGFSLPGVRAKMGYWLGLVFPSRAYMRERYRVPHDALLPFYYGGRVIKGTYLMARSLIAVGLGAIRAAASI